MPTFVSSCSVTCLQLYFLTSNHSNPFTSPCFIEPSFKVTEIIVTRHLIKNVFIYFRFCTCNHKTHGSEHIIAQTSSQFKFFLFSFLWNAYKQQVRSVPVVFGQSLVKILNFSQLLSNNQRWSIYSLRFWIWLWRMSLSFST